MKKFLINLLCLFIPDKAARSRLRKKAQTVSDVDCMARKITLSKNGDIHTLPNGIKFYCPEYPWDFIQRVIVNRSEFFDRDILDGLQKHIPENAVILDIGANVGNHSLYWACLLGEGGRIHAFEPVRNTHAYLLKNIEINGFGGRITPRNIGLGDKTQAGEIAEYSATNSGAATIRETERENPHSLKIMALDEIDLGEKKIDFVKIDVEGYELKTLAGMRKTLSKYRPAVFIESFATYGRVKAFFSELGYQNPVSFRKHNYLFLPGKA